MESPLADKRLTIATLAFAAALATLGLSGYGIWDPWELDIAEVARKWAAGEHAVTRGSPFGPWLSSLAFDALGVRERTGRLPIALSGLIAIALTYVLAARHAGKRAAPIAALALATTPFFLLNARLMLGAAPHVALQVWSAFALFELTQGDVRRGREVEGGRRFALRLAHAALACCASAAASGVLLGPLPVLIAASAASQLDSDRADVRLALTRATLLGVAGASAVGVWLAVRRDAPTYSHWLGGGAFGGATPSFEREVERIFHGFAPWSALFIPALGNLLRHLDAPPGEAPNSTTSSVGRPRALALFVIVWLAASYAAATLYSSRYGATPVYAAPALAIAVGVLVADASESGRTHWTIAIVGGLFALLLLRDFAMFPGTPVAAVPGRLPTVPEDGFDLRLGWALALVAFAASVVLTFGVGGGAARPNLTVVRGALREHWRMSVGHRLWFVLAGIAALGAVAFGIATLVAGGRFSSLGARIGRGLLVGIVALPVVIWGLAWGRYAVSRAARFRIAPLLLAGGAFGVFFAFVFVPQLSQHLSPREVFQTFDALRGPDETLGEHQTGDRAAAYYTDGEIETLSTIGAVVTHLAPEGGRTWAVFPRSVLSQADRQYRERTGEHLYLADTTNARVVLATSAPIEGRVNQNLLASTVVRELPRAPHHVLNAHFEERVELIGYDLELPAGDSVGPGQSFAITWYWRALPRIGGGYQIFLHIDGHGQRLNGDHVPVDGSYPVSNWRPGDIVVDRQELSVPANYPAGDYQMWIGFFAGSSRLALQDRPRCDSQRRVNCIDDANRISAGLLPVR